MRRAESYNLLICSRWRKTMTEERIKGDYEKERLIHLLTYQETSLDSLIL